MSPSAKTIYFRSISGNFFFVGQNLGDVKVHFVGFYFRTCSSSRVPSLKVFLPTPPWGGFVCVRIIKSWNSYPLFNFSSNIFLKSNHSAYLLIPRVYRQAASLLENFVSHWYQSNFQMICVDLTFTSLWLYSNIWE